MLSWGRSHFCRPKILHFYELFVRKRIQNYKLKIKYRTLEGAWASEVPRGKSASKLLPDRWKVH